MNVPCNSKAQASVGWSRCVLAGSAWSHIRIPVDETFLCRRAPADLADNPLQRGHVTDHPDSIDIRTSCCFLLYLRRDNLAREEKKRRRNGLADTEVLSVAKQ